MNSQLANDLALSGVKYLIGVVAGKGGVGKSTVSVNLALALNKLGFAVGLLDADLYGPSLKMMLGVSDSPKAEDGLILPVEVAGIKMLSIALFKQGQKGMAVRAPIANAMITQFFTDVKWGHLDYLIVDFPPGTGDIQLTMMQKALFSSAILVSTPQRVATLDVKKAMDMLSSMGVPLLGAVENMSYYINSHGDVESLFGKSHLEALGLPILAHIPLERVVSEALDSGRSIFDEETRCSDIFLNLASTVSQRLEKRELPVLEVLSNERFSLTFYDDLRYDFEVKEVQRACPCARCFSKERKELGELKEINLIGAYALKMKFTSGCSSGIYSFEYLKKLCNSPSHAASDNVQ